MIARRVNLIVRETGRPATIRVAGIVTMILALCFIIADFLPVVVSLIGAGICAVFGSWLIFQADDLFKHQSNRNDN